ncbi:hypothetical protein RJ639_005627 [Escallonia herrerae]|uniref:Uncharacterized protein n=1 Tax=Escallonia herrerae TaxID=1293975 RepID=A0AA88VW22_9ASTE|nr:hypothetical protein RJ639_005627 [Escallonia herrerae]
MADDAAKSETLAANAERGQTSVEATIQSNAQGGVESSCNNDINGETSGVTSGSGHEKSLDLAGELMEKGSRVAKEHDYAEATECFSRALEIRVAHYGELAPECVNAYYRYGCALLYKAQEETDPLGSVPKKEAKSQSDAGKDGSIKCVTSRESSAASVSNNTIEDGSSHHQDGAPSDDGSGKDQEEDDEESEAEDQTDADDDESDLDLAWKMLDVARAIVEKHSDDTMEKVDILSALAEVALEREDIDSSLSDYLKALSVLERLVEPDSRYIAELICLCLEIGSKAEEAIPYCQKAISVCKSRVQRLMNEVKSLSGSTATSAASESDLTAQSSSSASKSVDSVADKEGEIETLSGLSNLQQVVSNPTSILSDILGLMSAKARGNEKSAASAMMSSSRVGTANSSGDFESPTVSTAHTNGAAGVTNLGVVGRGVKRVTVTSAESSTVKKPALEPSSDKSDGNAS